MHINICLRILYVNSDSFINSATSILGYVTFGLGPMTFLLIRAFGNNLIEIAFACRAHISFEKPLMKILMAPLSPEY